MGGSGLSAAETRPVHISAGRRSVGRTVRRGTVRRRGIRTGAVALLLPAVAVLAGCGIRSTTVPVDAGPAPSRVSCAVPEAPATPPADTVLRPVYLVCSQQITRVRRVAELREAPVSAWSVAGELIRELQRSPGVDETRAGFSTAVPGNRLYLLAPASGDPRVALRLSQSLDELPSFALAQIICTFTDNPVIAPGHSVVLGGPAPTELRRYTCTSDLRTRSDAADTAGTPVGG
ncbi:hypothetical protein [Streptomyces sp. NBC_01190]|uniref:hypothetical protein n=1 Tax=Streptomyces sp. NBC_01190 TaxID=2903767 RepID=UPI00386E3BB0|nr:hypothetical protein OG519_22075 [Streptomyces sp. NBC_01190]